MERAKAAAQKPMKRPRNRKSNAPACTQETLYETIMTRESQDPRRRAVVLEESVKPLKLKKVTAKFPLGLANTILQANNLASKTKPADVEAMYKSLEEGLGQCFLYGQTRFLAKFMHKTSTLPLTP